MTKEKQMVRNDFVSNSSSSSFIVASTDNKYDILLQDYNILTLEEYMKHYFREDFLYYVSEPDMDIKNFKFVSDLKYNKAFSHSLYRTLPGSCKEDMEAYIVLYKNRPNGNWDSDNVRKWSKNMDDIMLQIESKCLEALKLDWKDVKFHSAEVDDNYIEDDREDLVSSEEEKVQERIDYMNQLKPLKFYRTFSHH